MEEDRVIELFKKRTKNAFDVEYSDEKVYAKFKVVPYIEVENLENEIIELVSELEHKLQCRNHEIRVLKKKLKGKMKDE